MTKIVKAKIVEDYSSSQDMTVYGLSYENDSVVFRVKMTQRIDSIFIPVINEVCILGNSQMDSIWFVYCVGF